MHVQKHVTLEEQYLELKRLVCEFSLESNATPNLKIHRTDLNGVLVLRTEDLTEKANDIEDLSLNFTAPIDNSSGNSIFGVLIHGLKELSKVYSINVYEKTSLASSFVVTPLGYNGLTPEGNIAFQINATGLNLASESPTFRLEMDYAEGGQESEWPIGIVATPTFSPFPGSYVGTQLVTVSSLTDDAIFYYTLDGSTPTIFSTLYTGPISVEATATLKVLGVKERYANSMIGSSSYVISAAGPSAVDLLTSSNYAILAKSAITDTTGSLVTGDMGISPAAAASITGFGLVLDGGGQFSTSASVVGQVYAADYAVPTPATLTQAISDMEAAYTDAAGRTSPDFTNLGAGSIGGLTLVPGLYKWTTGVTIPTDVTFDGGPSDVWILQISGTLGLTAAQEVLLLNGASANNIFWQVTGAVTLGASSTFNGVILAQTSIAIQTAAIFNGRALAQTAVTLDNVDISEVP